MLTHNCKVCYKAVCRSPKCKKTLQFAQMAALHQKAADFDPSDAEACWEADKYRSHLYKRVGKPEGDRIIDSFIT